GLARSPAGFGRRDQRLQASPFAIRHVAWITAADPLISPSMHLSPHSESSSDAPESSESRNSSECNHLLGQALSWVSDTEKAVRQLIRTRLIQRPLLACATAT